jgi:hypothetical protein
MALELLTGSVWSRLRSKLTKERSDIAVAYLGRGASKLLKVSKGSRIVVDASDSAVKTGQTCPDDLLLLWENGVRIFSAPNLHAKVYALKSVAFIGSANASQHSANTLLEALVMITDRALVQKAHEFVQSLCKNELGPKQLAALKRIYRPPHLPNAGANLNKKSASQVRHPPVRLVQLEEVGDWSKQEVTEHDSGWVARRYREHSRSWTTDSFQCDWPHSFQKHDKLVMITEVEAGRFLVHPPGAVLHTRRSRIGTRAFVYLEVPKRRRRALQAVAEQMGRGAAKRLRRNGALRRDFADAYLGLW